jgi:hypothetical protein
MPNITMADLPRYITMDDDGRLCEITMDDLLASTNFKSHLHWGLLVYLFDYMTPGCEGRRCRARNRRGKLVPPPNHHVLDYLARNHMLLPEDVTMWSRSTGTVAVVDKLARCGECGQEDARYDVPGSPWAQPRSLCPTCWDQTGETHLGPAEGAYLMLLTEVPSEVRVICDDITAELERPSLWT